MWTLEFKAKVLGKIIGYTGFTMIIAGLFWESGLLAIAGYITMIIGCLMHEANEK